MPSFQLDIQVSLIKQDGFVVTLFVLHANAMGFTSASFMERTAIEQGISALGFPAPSSKA